MEKQEMFEELKGNVLRKVNNREAIPEEIKGIVERSFEELLELYRYSGCDNESIKQYIEATKYEVNSEINKIGENRKNIQFQEFQYIMNRMQNEVEDNQERNEERDKQAIMEVDFEDRKSTLRIVETLEMALRDVQNRQNNILEARGFSDNQIDKINDEVRNYIYKFSMRQQENVQYQLDDDRKELTFEIIEEYEAYIQWEISEEKKNESEKESFREELDAGISLEEQREFAQKTQEEQSDEQKEIHQKNLDVWR